MKSISILGGILLAAGLTVSAKAETKILPSCSRTSMPAGLPRETPPKLVHVDTDSTKPTALAALSLAYNIENGLPDPWIGVTGNFDGMGLSLGIVQFNFAGSIQETFGSIPKSHFKQTMPVWGETFYQAVHTSSRDAAVALAIKMQTATKVRGKTKWTLDPVARAELRAFLGSTLARQAQNEAADVYRRGYSRAVQWAEARGAAKPTPREIASFVDNQVFSGGALGGIWIEKAKAFRSSFVDDGEMVEFVTSWLKSCPYEGAGFLYGGPDAATNVAAWRAAVPKGRKLNDEQALLFAFGFVRALTANGPPQVKGQPDQSGIFKAQVVERRGMMALGAGTANGVSWPGRVLE